MRKGLALVASQMRMTLSPPALAISLPSGLNIATVTGAACSRGNRTFPVSRCQTLAVLSALAETILVGAEVKEAVQTGPSCPSKSRDCRTMSKSHNRTVKSPEQEASWLPSGVKARALIG